MRLRTAATSALSTAFVALLLTGSLAPATHPLAAASPAAPGALDGLALTPQAKARLGGALDVQQGLQAFAAKMAKGQGATGALAQLAPHAKAPKERASATLEAAVARLTGQKTADAHWATGLDRPTTAALIRLVDGLHGASVRLDQAFARLTPAERATLVASALGPADDHTAPLEAKVDAQAIRDAAAIANNAVQAFMQTPNLQKAALPAAGAALSGKAATQPAPQPPKQARSPDGRGPSVRTPTGGVTATPATGAGGPLAPSGTTAVAAAATAPSALVCGAPLATLISPNGLVEIGFTGNDAYSTERMLIVDLGGNDCYQNYPASVGPGSGFPAPLSAIVDLGGDDTYIATSPHVAPTTPPATTWGSAVGIGGLGILADRWGNDKYTTTLSNEPSTCTVPGDPTLQRTFGQGVGILGAGLLIDEGGDDRYLGDSSNSNLDAVCKLGQAYSYEQGYASRLGLGLLVDDTGNDIYVGGASATGKAQNAAHTHAQGVAAARGIAALVDKEGNDLYRASASGSLPFTPPFNPQAATGYTFAQGALSGTGEPRPEGIPANPCALLPPSFSCANCSGLACPPEALTVPCQLDGDLIIPPNPATPNGVRVSENTPCDLQGVALLVDVLGTDTYAASSSASDGGMSCYDALWAGTAAQGSATTKGLAALLDLGLDTGDRLSAASYAAQLTPATAGCPGHGVRAYTGSQGFGGSFLWDLLDPPPFDAFLFTDVALGVLGRAGACGEPMDLSSFPSLTLTPPRVEQPCQLAWANDGYSADATADNSGANGPAWAQDYSQGSSNGNLTVAGFTYSTVGIGIQVDVAGDDVYQATAHTTGLVGSLAPLTVAQAGATTGTAVLVDVLGTDDYGMDSQRNGVSTAQKWPWVFGQGDAGIPAPVFTKLACVPTACLILEQTNAIAVFVDVLGEDTFSVPSGTQSPPPPPTALVTCNVPGTLTPGPVALWGNALVPVIGECTHNGPLISNGYILGLDT